MWDQDLFRKAMNFAAEKHGDQRVPGYGYPYLYHISLVAIEVMTCLSVEPHDDPDLALQCAILHDTIEDTGCTPAELEAAFGGSVASGVQALSKKDSLPTGERMRDSLERILGQPREIWMVKMADRIVNLGPPPAYWTRQKRENYRNEARLIHDRLSAASPFLARRLAEKTDEYAAYLV
jgi:(p)ppGpp synthase/HD superfamily hydrolase